MIKTALSLLLADQHILQPVATVMNWQLVHGVPHFRIGEAPAPSQDPECRMSSNRKWMDGCFECTGFLTFSNMFWAEKSINFIQKDKLADGRWSIYSILALKIVYYYVLKLKNSE